jgi:hemerythrin
MTRQLQWRDDWLLGLECLDADHRRLVELLNLLFSAPHQPAETARDDGGSYGPAPAPRVDVTECILQRLDRVTNHLRHHFAREEELLRSINFPNYDEHRSEHALQLAEFAELRRDIERRRARELDAETIGGIKRWFFNHVIAEDHHFAAYYYRQVLESEDDEN